MKDGFGGCDIIMMVGLKPRNKEAPMVNGVLAFSR